MTRHRVLAIGLDGFDYTLAERFMAEGHIPALADLQKRAARFLLDEGSGHRAGIPWESVGSGLSPAGMGRWAAMEFDSSSYTAWQEGSQFTPWWAESDLRVVVLDPPGLDLQRARNTQGIVAWARTVPGPPNWASRMGCWPSSNSGLATIRQRRGCLRRHGPRRCAPGGWEKV
jgi:hypothetical protein